MSVVINVVGQFDGKQLDRAQRELDKLGRNVKGQESKIQAMGNSFRAAGGLVAAAVGTQMVRSVVDFGLRMEEMSRTAEAVERRFDTVFGAMTDDMRAWVDEQNEAFGISRVELEGMAAAVGDLLVPLGFTREAAAGMSQEVLELGNALSEWTGGALSSAQAVEAVQKALLGEREQLKTLGVAINEADVQAALAAKGLEDLTGEALAQARAQVTLELVTMKSADALDAYADRAGTAQAETKELTAQLADAEQTIAGALAPEVDYVRGRIADLGETVAYASTVLAEMSGTDQSSLLEQMNELGLLNLNSMESFGNLFEAVLEWETGAGRGGSATRELTEDLDAQAIVAGEVERALADMGEAAHETERDIDNLAAAVKSSAQEQRNALNPIVQLREANERYDGALRNLQAVQADTEASASELEQAQWDLLEATADLQIANDEFSTTGVTGDMYALASAVGFTRDELERMISAFAALDGAKVTPQSTPGGGISVDATGWTLDRFHSGGVVPGRTGQEVPILAMAGETVLPTHRPSLMGSTGAHTASVPATVVNVANVYGWDDFVARVRDAGVDIQRLGI